MYNPKFHHRRSIRLKNYDYSNPNWYYITICTHNKKCIFGTIKNGKMCLNNFGKIVEQEWLKTKEVRKNIDLDYYVIMPNHFHGILIIEFNVGAIRRIAPTTTLQPNSLGSIIGQFKSIVTKRIRKLSSNNKLKIWQRNYYEHIIRNENDLFYTRKYIEQNPLKWELDENYNYYDPPKEV